MSVASTDITRVRWINDAEIIKLLEGDSDRALALLKQRFEGLVRMVVSGLISDSEDGTEVKDETEAGADDGAAEASDQLPLDHNGLHNGVGVWQRLRKRALPLR